MIICPTRHKVTGRSRRPQNGEYLWTTHNLFLTAPGQPVDNYPGCVHLSRRLTRRPLSGRPDPQGVHSGCGHQKSL
jgi:hypothetical protein